MKKKVLKKAAMMLVCFCAMFLVACGSNDTTDENQASSEPETSGSVASGSETGMDSNTTDEDTDTGTNSDTNTTDTSSNVGTANAQTADDNPINDNITGYYSETTAYPAFESELIDELDMEDVDMTSTRYYYNYVDLDDDGTDEIIVQLVGDNVSNDDGDLVCIVERDYNDDNDTEDDGFDIIQKFYCFANPIVISDNKTNGWKDIILLDSSADDGTTIYRKLTFDGEKYTNPTAGEVLDNIDDISGVAIMCNDIADDSTVESNDASDQGILYFSK